MEFAPVADVIAHIEECISDDEVCLTEFLDPDEIQGCKDDLARNRTILRALKSAPVAEQIAKDAARLQHLMDESGQWFIEVGYPAMMMGRLREAIDTAMGAQPEAPVAEPPPQALQELADQAQKLDMGYGDREAFEAWLMKVHLLDATWNESRNCFDEFPAHLAYKAWQAASQSRPELSDEELNKAYVLGYSANHGLTPTRHTEGLRYVSAASRTPATQ